MALPERTVIIVPGLRGSGAAHWQSLWQASHRDYVRVLHDEWAAPALELWAARVDGAICAARGQAFVVAHGFGCLATLRRLALRHAGLGGALLVAPRDPLEFGVDALLPSASLEVPSILVASRNDPWMGFAAAKRLAARLGSRFVDAGQAGHIDAASGYGPWPRGERLLGALFSAARAQEYRLRVALALVA